MQKLQHYKIRVKILVISKNAIGILYNAQIAQSKDWCNTMTPYTAADAKTFEMWMQSYFWIVISAISFTFLPIPIAEWNFVQGNKTPPSYISPSLCLQKQSTLQSCYIVPVLLVDLHTTGKNLEETGKNLEETGRI